MKQSVKYAIIKRKHKRTKRNRYKTNKLHYVHGGGDDENVNPMVEAAEFARNARTFDEILSVVLHGSASLGHLVAGTMVAAVGATTTALTGAGIGLVILLIYTLHNKSKQKKEFIIFSEKLVIMLKRIEKTIQLFGLMGKQFHIVLNIEEMMLILKKMYSHLFSLLSKEEQYEFNKMTEEYGKSAEFRNLVQQSDDANMFERMKTKITGLRNRFDNSKMGKWTIFDKSGEIQSKLEKLMPELTFHFLMLLSEFMAQDSLFKAQALLGENTELKKSLLDNTNGIIDSCEFKSFTLSALINFILSVSLPQTYPDNKDDAVIVCGKIGEINFEAEKLLKFLEDHKYKDHPIKSQIKTLSSKTGDFNKHKAESDAEIDKKDDAQLKSIVGSFSSLTKNSQQLKAMAKFKMSSPKKLEELNTHFLSVKEAMKDIKNMNENYTTTCREKAEKAEAEAVKLKEQVDAAAAAAVVAAAAAPPPSTDVAAVAGLSYVEAAAPETALRSGPITPTSPPSSPSSSPPKKLIPLVPSTQTLQIKQQKQQQQLQPLQLQPLQPRPNLNQPSKINNGKK